MDKKLSRKALLAIIIGVLAIVAIICAVILLNRNKLTAMVMRLIRQEGEVTLLDASGQDQSILENMKLYSGNSLHTGGNGLVDLSLDETKYLTIEKSSKVDFIKSGKALELKLNEGRLFFNVTEKLADDETMDISTSTMVVGIRGTSGWVDAENSDLYVGDGTLHVTGINPKTGERIEADFTAGQKVHVYLLDEDGKTVAFELENYTIQDVPREMLRNIVQYPALFERFVEATGFEPKAVIREAIIKEILPDDMVLPEEYEELLEEVIEEMKEPEEEEEEEEPAEEETEEVEEVQTPTTRQTVQQQEEEETPPAETPPAQQQAATTTETTPTTYTVTVGSATGGSGTPSPSSAEEGASVTLTATPDSGYEFSGWTVNEGGVTLANPSAASTTFTMPAANVTVTPAFTYTGVFKATVAWYHGGGGGTYMGTARITNISTNESGTSGLVTMDYYSSLTVLASAGNQISIAADPLSEEFVFDHWIGGSVDISDGGFTMPEQDVTLKAQFVYSTYNVTLVFPELIALQFEGEGVTSGETIEGLGLDDSVSSTQWRFQFLDMPDTTAISSVTGGTAQIEDHELIVRPSGEDQNITVTLTAQ